MEPQPDYRNLLTNALVKIRELKARVGELEKDHQNSVARFEPIAIVGMGCRLPGGIESPADFWRLLKDGRQTVSRVPPDRWRVEDFFNADRNQPSSMCSDQGSFLDNVEHFDADFFGISKVEAASMDPQHRLLLETSWQALEHAGQSTDALYGTPVGVFVGISSHDYAELSIGRRGHAINAYFGTGISHSTAVGRISHLLGLQGPSIAVDTACSSSLVAVHMACQNLRSGECDMALAGGVNVVLLPEYSIYFSQAGLMSPTGRCRTFDAAADGSVRGEGCGVVVLKRLSDAETNRDNIIAVIRGSAVNHDGPSGGLTVPNGPAQQALIRRALHTGQVAPEDVDYVEAHGAGTPLGDSIEILALSATYGKGRPADRSLIVGSHKTNLGHLESAGGVVALIKTAMSLEHGEIPRHLNFEVGNPNVPWNDLPIRISTEHSPWPHENERRIATVSSFSFSGTNAHAVMERRKTVESVDDGQFHVLTMSARSQIALKRLAQEFLTALPNLDSFASSCFTSNLGRGGHESHEYRLAVVANSTQQATAALADFLEGNSSNNVYIAMTPDVVSPSSPNDTAVTEHDPSHACHASAATFARGEEIDWSEHWAGSKCRRVPLPTYPFQRERFWIDQSDQG
ncbi:MAG: beta-ketoacyl synthase N-terminal-like domain-containing protein [Planctomycetota bacterium]|nr:beta-ketoacyl synthase N-terminal-like domain-containing protein [Planctomycetota bacterium]